MPGLPGAVPIGAAPGLYPAEAVTSLVMLSSAKELCRNESVRSLIPAQVRLSLAGSHEVLGSQYLRAAPPLTQCASASLVFQWGAGMLAKKVQYAIIVTGSFELSTAFVSVNQPSTGPPVQALWRNNICCWLCR